MQPGTSPAMKKKLQQSIVKRKEILVNRQKEIELKIKRN